MHVWHAQIDESDGWRLLQGCGIANQVHASQGTLRRGQPQAAGHHITWLVDGGAKAPTGVPPRMRTRTALDAAPSRTHGPNAALGVRPLAGGVDGHRRRRRGTARGPRKNRQVFRGPEPPRGGPRRHYEIHHDHISLTGPCTCRNHSARADFSMPRPSKLMILDRRHDSSRRAESKHTQLLFDYEPL